MGLDLQNLRALLAAKASGANFTCSATLGRQAIMLGHEEFLRGLREFHQPAPAELSAALSQEFADDAYQAVTGCRMESVDVSDYESATHIQDMNLPLNPGLRERFSLLIDGGSLEHVYNIPQAFDNCAAMVRPGGHLLICNIANNFCGHGFYQFSPELFWRIFSPENGFKVEWMVFAEYGGSGDWVSIPDPAAVDERMNFTNAVPTYIFALAKKTRTVERLRPPQQSDYVTKWTASDSGKATRKGIASRLPLALKMRLRSILNPYGRNHLTPVRAWDLRGGSK